MVKYLGSRQELAGCERVRGCVVLYKGMVRLGDGDVTYSYSYMAFFRSLNVLPNI